MNKIIWICINCGKGFAEEEIYEGNCPVCDSDQITCRPEEAGRNGNGSGGYKMTIIGGILLLISACWLVYLVYVLDCEIDNMKGGE